MKSQGLTNNQIIQTLQRDGYSSKDIFEALNQVAIQPSQPLNNPQPDSFRMAQPSGPAPPSAPPLPAARAGGPSDEELIEAIIDEKWNDLLEDINRIISWKERTSQRIDAFDQQMKDLKEQFDKLHQAVIGKVGEYDQHILQVGAEVKAMEKVFSKVLPMFTENVAEISRVAEDLKKQVPKKK